ncbi:MAG: hypothetical protein CL916_14930 [Deltaproteobacteria bacterium]|nr:hypothetical protein [Deltaproteobacteria bacterium]
MLIAKLLNRKFYILWTKEPITRYVDFQQFAFTENVLPPNINIKLHNCIDKQDTFRSYLMESEDLYLEPIHVFYNNQEIAQYIYKNKRFAHRNFLEDITALYKTLYTEIMVPKSNVTSVAKRLLNNHQYVVGVQIRFGDYVIPEASQNRGNEKIYERSPEEVVQKLIKIKEDLIHKGVYEQCSIYLVSDFSQIEALTQQVFPKEKIIYFNRKIEHMDRTGQKRNMIKIFVDSYILSQKTNLLYLDRVSNYGRIAGLSCPHEDIFDIDAQRLERREILSKGEMIW